MTDTLSANIAESVTEMVTSAITLIPQMAPMPNIVTRRVIPKGHDRLELPRVNSTSSVQTPTEGDDLLLSSQFDLTSTTIQPTRRVVMVRIGARAAKFTKEDLIALVSEEMAQTQAQDMDTDLTAEFVNFTTHTTGTTNVDLTLDVLRTSRRLLHSNTRSAAQGGPAPNPIHAVLAPIPEENLMTDLGFQGVTALADRIPNGSLSSEIIERFSIPGNIIAGVRLWRDGYMTEDGSSDFICAMYSERTLFLAISEDWDMKTFEVPNFDGVILRSIADYESGIGGYEPWGVAITADGA